MVEELIELLQQIDKMDPGNIEYIEGCPPHQLIIEKDSEGLSDRIEDMANEVLITDGGQCEWEAINKVKEAGYNVFPGDKDSFGWLVGCIRTKVGIITFG